VKLVREMRDYFAQLAGQGRLGGIFFTRGKGIYMMKLLLVPSAVAL
jgi:hypothetical protein